MPRFGKHDAQGRSSGILSGRTGKVMRPPKGEPWVWLTRELLTSAAWRGCSPYARLIIDFLLVEHMNHAGRDNGRLAATYSQLADWGVPRKLIASALWELVEFGLVERTEEGSRNRAALYRLTFYACGLSGPTNEWRSITPEIASGIAEVAAKMRQHARGRDRPKPSKPQIRVVQGGRA